MDDYAEGMIARGPTLADDGVTPTGSLHIVDLPNAEAARVFAFEEPNYKAGVYAEVFVRRWRNALGRTMWQFAGEPESVRFLVIAHGKPNQDDGGWDVAALGDRLIVCGPLLAEDGSTWVGDALAASPPPRLPSRNSSTFQREQGSTSTSRSTAGSSAGATETNATELDPRVVAPASSW